MKITTYTDVRLGDNLAHLHFLRAVAKKNPNVHFEHAAHLGYLPQMVEVIADLPNISLRDLRSINKKKAINAWKNRDRFWEQHPLRNDYGPFMLEWFRELGGDMGVSSPLKTQDDLLFDYPAIKDTASEQFDFLIVNSQPMSGQWRSMDIGALDQLAIDLSEKHRVVTTAPVRPFIQCTQRTNVSITGIGGISRFCRYIIMVSTGASWGTFNVWNRDTIDLRIVFLEEENIQLTPNTTNTNSVQVAREMLMERGLL